MKSLRIPIHRLGWFVNILTVGGSLALGHQIVTGSSLLRISAAVGLIVMLGVPAIERPQSAMLALFCWLPFLGIARRALIPTAGVATLDPLLLVSTAISLIALITLMISRRASMGGTGLAKIFFAFMVIVIIQLFNPEQGSVLVALTGIMFVVIPLATFIIGRSVADEAYTRKLQYIVIGTGMITAFWGLKQVYIGFAGFEMDWIKCCGYGALKINNTYRPFSTFTSSLEFGGYMAFGVIVCFSQLLYAKGYARILLLGCASIMAYAGYLCGSRGVVIGTLLALFVLIGMRAKSRMFGFAVILILIGGAITWSATNDSAHQSDVADGVEQLHRQQVEALSDPFNSRVSSLPSHISQVKEGFVYSVHNPAGLGTGAITRGGQKFRQGTQTGTELDFSNAFLAFGAIGGAMYILVVVRTLWQLYVLRRKTMSPMWAAVLGMCIVMIGNWLNGGAYALNSLIWFMIGASDLAYQRIPKTERFAHPNAVPEEVAA